MEELDPQSYKSYKEQLNRKIGFQVLTRPRFRFSVHGPENPFIEEVIVDSAEDDPREATEEQIQP